MNKELRRIFTSQLYFLNEFNSILKENDSIESDKTEFVDTIAYLTKNSNTKPKLYKLICGCILNLVLVIIYYYCVISDLYLCYCYLINSEFLNLTLTCLWFFLPSVILTCGEIKTFYTKYFKTNKLKFTYKSLFACFIYAFKLNIFYA